MSAGGRAESGEASAPGAASAKTVVGVVGAGLIGGSIVQRLLQDGRFTVLVADRDPSLQAEVEAAGAVWCPASGDLAARAEHVFVAVSPGATAAVVAELLAGSPTVLVADASSVKEAVVRGVRTAAADPAVLARFQPMHPLSGAPFHGWAHASPALLDGAPWALCPVQDAPATADQLVRWSALVDALGGYFVPCGVAEHDAAVAASSHMPHVVASALARQVGLEAGPLARALSGGGLRDTTRIAWSTGPLWDEIVGANREATLRALDGLVHDLAEQRDRLAAGQPLTALWAAGGAGAAAIKAGRWDERTWSELTLPAGDPWPELLRLGGAGRGVRRLAAAGASAGLTAQVSAAAPPADAAQV